MMPEASSRSCGIDLLTGLANTVLGFITAGSSQFASPLMSWNARQLEEQFKTNRKWRNRRHDTAVDMSFHTAGGGLSLRRILDGGPHFQVSQSAIYQWRRFQKISCGPLLAGLPIKTNLSHGTLEAIRTPGCRRIMSETNLSFFALYFERLVSQQRQIFTSGTASVLLTVAVK